MSIVSLQKYSLTLCLDSGDPRRRCRQHGVAQTCEYQTLTGFLSCPLIWTSSSTTAHTALELVQVPLPAKASHTDRGVTLMPTAPSLVAQLLLKGGAAPYCAHRPTLPQFSNITIQRSCVSRQIRHYTAEFAPPRWAAALPYTGIVLQYAVHRIYV